MATKKFTRKELAEKNTKKEAVLVIDNVVYDVTQYLDEHPGGHEILIGQAGADATEVFEDVGHSLDAKELMKKFRLGEVVDEDRVEVKKRVIKFEEPRQLDEDSGLFGSWKLPLLISLVVTFVYIYVL